MTKTKKDQVLEVISEAIEDVRNADVTNNSEYIMTKDEWELYLLRLKEKVAKVLNS